MRKYPSFMMFRCREVKKDYTSLSSMSVRDHREKPQSPRPYKITESYKHSASPLQVNHILQLAAGSVRSERSRCFWYDSAVSLVYSCTLDKKL